MKPSTQKALSLALSIALSAPALPSQEPQEPTYSSNVRVVNVLATVREKGGAIVHDLTKNDFLLTEDGRLQNIKYFSQVVDQPLTIGLLVDTSLSQQNVLPEERAASYAFLNSMLRDAALLADSTRRDPDQAFLIHFDFEVELLQDLTSSHRQLETALDELGIPSQDRVWRRNFQRRRGGGPRGGGGPRRGGGGMGTLLYDAVYLAAHDVIAPVQGRKALIILSDGEDHGSKMSLEESVEAAQRADTVVYSILFSENSGNIFDRMAKGGTLIGGAGDGKKVLEKISKETGGRMFEVSRKLPIRQIYAQIEEELRNQYSLGYSSDRQDDSISYRKISVTTRRKNLIVQARDGYYPNRQMK
ncbi:MAG TPA: VWA domain-containing protein [Terriglobales bacterium]|nr:VWA domain-containing protein [Terriglobales bacterium]